MLIFLATGCGRSADSPTVPTVTPNIVVTDITSASSSDVEGRLQSVENGLISFSEDGQFDWEEHSSITERMEYYNVQGVSVAVINDNQIEWSKGYGVMEAGKDKPVTTETLFHACSVAKPVSAAGVLTLVEAGLLDLDENVNEKLVSWQVPENAFTEQEKVTLRRVLSHTSGLNDGFESGGWECCYATEGAAPDVTVKQMLVADPLSGISEATYVKSTPGGAYRYNNLAYNIVQPLLEDVTNEPFAAFMQSAVLDPLKMNFSTYEQPLPLELRDRATTEHGVSGEPAAGKRRHYPILAAGGLWTTPSDLARFTIELMSAYNRESSTILSQDMAKEMLSPQVKILGNPMEKAYGLGMALGDDYGVMRIQHTGGCPWGSNVTLIAYPETGQGAVVMTNSANGSAIRVEIWLSIAIEYGWPMVSGVGSSAD
ncbi:serine hydrolase domain-containing protein [Chloroflexota bacterium]